MYESISEYRDSASMIDECDIQRQVEELGMLLNESKEGDIIKWGDTQWIIIEKTGDTCVAFSKEKYKTSPYSYYKGNPVTRYTWNNSRIKELLNTDYYEQGINEAIKRRIRYDEEYDCNVRIIDIEEYTNNMDLLNSKISAAYWILDIDNDNDKYGLTRTVTFYGGKKDSIEKKYKTTSLPIYPVVTLSLN